MKAWKILFVVTLLASPAMAQETKTAETKPATKPAATAKAATAPSATPAAAAAPASQPAKAAVEPPIVPGEPLTPAEAVDKVKEGIAFGKAKNWFGMSSVLILVVVFLFKVLRDKFFPAMKRRWLYIIVPILGVAAMLLAKFAGGVSWDAAWLVLTSAPCAALLSDFIKRGILGQEPTAPTS